MIDKKTLRLVPPNTCNGCDERNAMTKVRKQIGERSIWYLCLDCWDVFMQTNRIGPKVKK